MATNVGDIRRRIRSLAAMASGVVVDVGAIQARADAAKQDAATAMATANAASQLARLSRIDFGLLSISFQALATLQVAPQAVVLDVADAKLGDRVNLYPVSVPAGYAPLGNGYSAADGKVSLLVLRPVLGLAVNVTLTVRAIAYRDLPA